MSVAQGFRAAPKMGRLRTHAPAIAMQVKKSGNTDARVPTAEESRKKNPTGVPIADKFKVRVRVRVRVRSVYTLWHDVADDIDCEVS